MNDQTDQKGSGKKKKKKNTAMLEGRLQTDIQ